MSKIKQEALIRSSLQIASLEDTQGDVKTQWYGRGRLSGTIVTIMDAIAIVTPLLPDGLDWACVPNSWHEDFERELQIERKKK